MKIKTRAFERFRFSRMNRKNRKENQKIADQFYIDIGGEVGMYRLLKRAAEARQKHDMVFVGDDKIFEECKKLGI